MIKLVRRPAAGLCLALLLIDLSGCRRVTRHEPEQVIPPGTSGTKEQIVGVTMRDGTEVRFDSRPRADVRGDTVHAWVRVRPFAVAISDVQRVWIARVDPARTTLAIVSIVAGVAAVLFAIALASKESCPFVYSWDGSEYVFDAEPYGGAVTRGLERDDYSRLEHLRVDSAGLYRIMVANEVNETQFTNAMRLLVVDHAAGARVEVDEWGRMYGLGAVIPPLVARDQDGRDLLPWLRLTDRAIWEPLPPADPSGRVRQEIELIFPKPVGATSARLVANVSTGLWGSHMIREMLELRGDSVGAWYAAIDSSANALETLRRWNVREELYVLKIEVAESNGWQVRGLLPGGGPFISEERVVPLDVSRVEGDTLRIRLRPPLGFWALNSFGVSYDASGAISVDTIAPLWAVASDGRDVLAELRDADDEYYAMPTTGDYGYVAFRAPAPPRAGVQRSVFLHTRGYYRLDLGERGTPDVSTLSRITEEPDAAARLAAERFAKQHVGRSAP